MTYISLSLESECIVDCMQPAWKKAETGLHSPAPIPWPDLFSRSEKMSNWAKVKPVNHNQPIMANRGSETQLQVHNLCT